MTSLARQAWKGLIEPFFRRPAVVQVAGLCWRVRDDALQVLLVQSSRGRWILPKGWPIEGMNGPETALHEAWEEAGVRKGKAKREALGPVADVKRFDTGQEVPCELHIYPIRVEKTVMDYPEAGERDRKWMAAEKAAATVDNPELATIIRDFAASRAHAT